MNWLRNFWHRQQRSIDLQILWPACKHKAPDLEHAKAAFAVHAFNDNAWLTLGHDAIVDIIDELS